MKCDVVLINVLRSGLDTESNWLSLSVRFRVSLQ